MGIEQMSAQLVAQALQIGADAQHAFVVAGQWVQVVIPLGVASILGLLYKASQARG